MTDDDDVNDDNCDVDDDEAVSCSQRCLHINSHQRVTSARSSATRSVDNISIVICRQHTTAQCHYDNNDDYKTYHHIARTYTAPTSVHNCTDNTHGSVEL